MRQTLGYSESHAKVPTFMESSAYLLGMWVMFQLETMGCFKRFNLKHTLFAPRQIYANLAGTLYCKQFSAEISAFPACLLGYFIVEKLGF